MCCHLKPCNAGFMWLNRMDIFSSSQVPQLQFATIWIDIYYLSWIIYGQEFSSSILQIEFNQLQAYHLSSNFSLSALYSNQRWAFDDFFKNIHSKP